MSRVISVLSKTKEQLEEYKKIKNEKFDKKILRREQRVLKVKEQKAKFNEEISQVMAEIKD